jgi:hypothetical protein
MASSPRTLKQDYAGELKITDVIDLFVQMRDQVS